MPESWQSSLKLDTHIEWEIILQSESFPLLLLTYYYITKLSIPLYKKEGYSVGIMYL